MIPTLKNDDAHASRLMKIRSRTELLFYDSFSVRSMATKINTDVKILIDPSISIAPKRFGLPPSKEELKELEKGKEFLSKEQADIIIITHYHWDHCPKPTEKHYKILFKGKLFVKDFNKTNLSQKNRAQWVLKGIKNFVIADGKTFEIGNTLIKFSEGVNHGLDSKLGKVLMVHIEYKDFSFLFGSDIQYLDEEKIKFILDVDPEVFVFSGPPLYLWFLPKKIDEFVRSLERIVSKTRLKYIIIDHHTARSERYIEFLNEIREKLNDFDVKVLSAAEFMNKEIRMLEVKRKNLSGNPGGGI